MAGMYSQYSPAPYRPPQRPPRPRKDHRLLVYAGVAVGVVVGVTGVVHGIVTGNWAWTSPPGRQPAAHSGGGNFAAPVPEPTAARRPATFRATVVSYVAVNPADLSVTIRIRNTGTEPGTPDCTISASDPSGSYRGWDEAVMKGTLAGGQSTGFTDNGIVVTSQGAGYVTSVTASCRPS